MTVYMLVRQLPKVVHRTHFCGFSHCYCDCYVACVIYGYLEISCHAWYVLSSSILVIFVGLALKGDKLIVNVLNFLKA